MTQREAYAMGFDAGHGIGCENRSEFKRSERERYMDECLEHEQDAYRQFSPFEFHAQAFNNSRNPDATWERYDAGVIAGLKRAWNQR